MQFEFLNSVYAVAFWVNHEYFAQMRSLLACFWTKYSMVVQIAGFGTYQSTILCTKSNKTSTGKR